MRIRRFRPADASRVSYLIRKALREANARDYPPEEIRAFCHHYRPANVIHLATECETFVLARGSRILATGSLDRNWLSGFFVNPRYHRRGLGRALLTYLETVAAKAGHRALRLGSSITALPFYLALGYTRDPKQPKGPQDIVILRKRLPRPPRSSSRRTRSR
jgi:GNAT superfamily N-acetyltransferase